MVDPLTSFTITKLIGRDVINGRLRTLEDPSRSVAIGRNLLLPIETEAVENSFSESNLQEGNLEDISTPTRELSTLLDLAREDVKQRTLCVERNPIKHSNDIAERLVKNYLEFNENSWYSASPEQRLNILRDGYVIMAEESYIPYKLIETTVISSKDMDANCHGLTNLFVRYNPADGRLFTDSELYPVNITFNAENLANPSYSLRDALGTLYHETLHVMQQQCVSESGNTFCYDEMKKDWEKDLLSRMSGDNTGVTYLDYINTPMESFPHAYTENFLKIYNAKVQELGDAQHVADTKNMLNKDTSFGYGEDSSSKNSELNEVVNSEYVGGSGGEISFGSYSRLQSGASYGSHIKRSGSGDVYVDGKKLSSGSMKVDGVTVYANGEIRT